MGWKRIKEKYRIEHFVQVRDGCIAIGSSFIPDLIVIDMNGRIVRADICMNNSDLNRYHVEMLRDGEEFLRRLIQMPDEFEKSITVWTYKDGRIIEKKCEALGYPLCTHDGCIMYGN